MTMNALRPAVLLALLSAPASANNIITAEHPPINPRGWTLQLDNRPTYSESRSFVNNDGTETRRSQFVRQDLMIVRLFLQNAMLRASIPYTSQSVNAAGRFGFGDMFFEAGAWLDHGPWRFRFLGFVKAPTGDFDRAKAVNIGSGQWDFGPSFYVTRYFDEKRVDLNLQTQYAFKQPNRENGQRPGNDWNYNAAVARRFELGAQPVRLGFEHRALFGEPNRRDGVTLAGARQSLSIGPVAQLDMSRFVKGFSLWPTMIVDVYNRNTARTNLYYLRINYNY